MTRPPDAEARRIIVQERHRSLLVEASAGTGKTHSIIDALIELAVDREPPMSLARIAATTFTEKAAGEMKGRLRSRLREIAREGESNLRRVRALRALDELDDSEVTTLHSLCASLLKERPLEAGLEPGFARLDPAASEALARRVWEQWWREQLESDPGGPLGRALVAGARLGDLDMRGGLTWLALQLYRNRAKLDGAALPAPDAEPLLRKAREWIPTLERIAGVALLPKDPKVMRLREIIEWLSRLPGDLDGLRTSAASAPELHFRGTRAWEPDARSELETWRTEYKRFLELLPKTEHWPLVNDVIASLTEGEQSFLGRVAASKREANSVDFDDLLLFARDLLKNSPAAREHFRRRFQFLVVDEFQDTDPLQAEIIFRLAHEEGGAPGWRELRPVPGRLLLVGDPKQSIYRFRRADVETYAAVEGVFAGETVRLEASRRSVLPILEWVNRTFGAIMKAHPERPFEVPYAPLSPWGLRTDPREKRIVYLDPPSGRKHAAGEAWRVEEASAIATFLHAALTAGRLQVGDPPRPAQPGDIAVLVRSNDAVGRIQEALGHYGIESVLEGGQDFFKREEPAAVLCALRAIDNPTDAVSLYAALKSFLFGFSDEELFLAREECADWDYRRPVEPAELREAFEILARLHRERHSRPASETVLELFEATGALETSRARKPGGLQARANLLEIVSFARRLEPIERTFGSVVAGLAQISESPSGEPRAFEEDEPAVRVMTVHKAKGLEFPVVVIADFGGSRSENASGSVLLSRSGGPWGVRITFAGEEVPTPGFDEVLAADRERQLAEERRLLYVAATRARDWLILSRWHRVGAGRSVEVALDSTILGLLGGEPHRDLVEHLVSIEHPEPLCPEPLAEPLETADASAAASLETDLREIGRRRAETARTKSAPLRRAGGEAVAAFEDSPTSDRADRGAAGPRARKGSAVHAALEAILGREAGIASAVESACANADISPAHAGDVREMVERALGSPLLQSSRGKRRLVEAPVVFKSPDDGAIVEGKIDLLFEEHGGWVIVDYKTDAVSRFKGNPGALRDHFARYAPQLREYATALRILKVSVSRAVILSTRTGDTFEFAV